MNENHQRNRKKLNSLVGTALLVAILLMLAITGLGIVPLTPLGVTILQIPVIVAVLAYGLRSGITLGACFGLWSLYRAYTAPTPFNVPFMNPLIAVLPRMLIPLAVWLLARGIQYKRKPSWRKSAVLGAVGSLVNTLFVLGLMGLLYSSVVKNMLPVSEGGIWVALAAFGVVSGIPEAIVSALLVSVIMGAFVKLNSHKRG